jgi:hypothetical protein
MLLRLADCYSGDWASIPLGKNLELIARLAVY